MIEEGWDEITLSTIETLIKTDTREGKTLEFKRELSADKIGHKAKFVGEITSFANDQGGDLVVGIVDKKGTATALWPVELNDPDQTVDQWVNVIKNKTDPPLSQHLVDIKVIDVKQGDSECIDPNGNNKGEVLVVRVRPSWRSPHRETYNDRFYERSASGKSELDTGSIRRAMLQGQEVVDRARRFRDDRLGSIQVEEGPLRMVAHEPLLVLHSIPSDGFAPGGGIDLEAATSRSKTPPVLLDSDRIHTGTYNRYTADGYLTARRDRESNQTRVYTLTFRSGIVEAVSSVATTLERDERNKGKQYINSQVTRSALENHLPRSVEFLIDQGTAYPIYVFFSVLNGEGCRIGKHNELIREGARHEIDRDIARLPEVVIETPRNDIDEHINTLMDAIFNASGKSAEPRKK